MPSVAFSGTYTVNSGERAASGTVTITGDTGATSGALTLDANGAYSTTVTGNRFTVVEAITGAASRTFKVSAVNGAPVDTSRDVGIVPDTAGSSGATAAIAAAIAAEVARANGAYGAIASANVWAGQQTFQNGTVRGRTDQVSANEFLQSSHAGWVGGSRWESGIDTSNNGGGTDYFMAKASWRSMTDGATTSGSPTVTSASALFGTDDVNQPITGPGIPANSYIGIVNSATSIGLSSSSSSNVPVNATATATGVTINVGTSGTVGDVWYWSHNGGDPCTLGIGVTPPDGNHRVQMAAAGTKPAQGTLKLLMGASQTGDALTLMQSNGSTKNLFITPAGVVSGQNGQGLTVKADATNNRSVVYQDNTGAQSWGWLHTGSTFISFRNITGGANLLTFDTSGNAQLGKSGAGIGFFGAAAATKQSITGALSTVTDAAAKAVLTSIVNALATSTLMTNSTT